jgi:uncharacterized membrane protein (UPF0127 family)
MQAFRDENIFMKRIDVLRDDGSRVCTAEVADGLVSRGWGLLGRKGLEPEKGLLITPCTSVHTFFMRFTIDVLYLSPENSVVKVVPGMKAFRMSMGAKGAKKVLELPKGTLERHDIKVGEHLELRGANEP